MAGTSEAARVQACFALIAVSRTPTCCIAAAPRGSPSPAGKPGVFSPRAASGAPGGATGRRRVIALSSRAGSAPAARPTCWPCRSSSTGWSADACTALRRTRYAFGPYLRSGRRSPCRRAGLCCGNRLSRRRSADACRDARRGRAVRQPYQSDPDRHIGAGDPRLHCRPADRANRRHRLQRRRDGGLEHCRNMDGRRSLAVDGCPRAADGRCGRTGWSPRLCSRARPGRARIPARNISLRDRDQESRFSRRDRRL